VREAAFREWLASNYADNTVSTQLSAARRLEAAYGDLDEIFDEDGFAGLLAELKYSSSDQANQKPNPSKLQIDGNLYPALAFSRTALRIYKSFRQAPEASSALSDAAIEVAGELIKQKKEGRQFEIERHLQDSLRQSIQQLEVGMEIIDGGTERGVDSGLIDITTIDKDGKLVVIELKRGRASRESIGQILGYMGDLKNEEPEKDVRGILVAADFDQSCVSARRFIPQLTLKRYSFSFAFEDC
jgi:endonuclease